MAQPDSSTWPPPAGLTTPTVSHAQAILTLSGSTRIAAPAASVFAAVLQVGDWSKWNSFVPRVTTPDGQPLEKLELNVPFVFHVIMNSNKPHSETATSLRCVDISTPEAKSTYVPQAMLESGQGFTADLNQVYRVAWRSDSGFLMSKGLTAERFHEVIVIGEKECEVRTWELQNGPLVYVVKALFGTTLEGKFDNWCRELKAYCEDRKD